MKRLWSCQCDLCVLWRANPASRTWRISDGENIETGIPETARRSN